MNIHKLINRGILLTGTLVMSTPLLLGGVTANANGGGSVSNAYSDSDSGSVQWTVAHTTSKESAWDKFINEAIRPFHPYGSLSKSTIQRLSKLDPGDQDNCKQSKSIAWTHGNSGKRITYSARRTQDLPSASKVTNDKYLGNYAEHDNTWNSKSSSNYPIVVCSYKYQQNAKLKRVFYKYKFPDYMGTDKSDTVDKNTTHQTLKLYGILSTQTQITPNLLDGQSADDPNYQATHEIQTTSPQMNRWSNWVKSLNTKSFNAYNKDMFDEARKKSAELKSGDYAAHPNLELSAKNRKGFAQGGVITVSENSVNTSVAFSGYRHWVRHKYYSHVALYWTYKIVNKDTGKPASYDDLTNVAKKEYKEHKGAQSLYKSDNRDDVLDKATKTDELPVNYTNYITGNHLGPAVLNNAWITQDPTDATYSSTKQWQMINVRCNKDKFNELANSIPGFVNTSNQNGDGASTGHTKVYTMDGHTVLPLGNTNNSGIQGETGYKSFYENDQSCRMSIDCNSIRRPSASNASRNNVQNHGKNAKNSSGDATYGAQSQGVSSDTFSFFRDGKQHAIRTDLWYPVAKSNTSISVDSDSPALFTRMYFDPNGTPGKLFGIANSAGGADFLSGSQVQNGTAYRENGELVNFYPHATWASSSSNPERFNIDWTWRPTITNNIYSSVNGAYPGGNTVQDKSSIYATCPIAVDTTDTHHPTIKNSLNDDPVGNLTSFDSSDKASVAIGFVRSTSDEH